MSKIVSKAKTSTLIVASIFTASILLSSCAEEPKKPTKLETEKAEFKQKNSQLLEVSGKVFSIPSPMQTALLLKESGASYDNTLLNSTSSAVKNETASSKALNLGIYGADLGYATIFDNTEDAIEYVATTKKMSGELGISNRF